MIFTPVRWVVMVGIAACGYFLITSPSMSIRAAAFLGSLVCWQIHGIVLVADAYALMQMQKAKAKEGEPSIDELFALLKKHYDLTDAELGGMKKSRGVHDVENNQASAGQPKPDAVASSVR